MEDEMSRASRWNKAGRRNSPRTNRFSAPSWCVCLMERGARVCERKKGSKLLFKCVFIGAWLFYLRWPSVQGCFFLTSARTEIKNDFLFILASALRVVRGPRSLARPASSSSSRAIVARFNCAWFMLSALAQRALSQRSGPHCKERFPSGERAAPGAKNTHTLVQKTRWNMENNECRFYGLRKGQKY